MTGWFCEGFLRQSLETIIGIYTYSHNVVGQDTCATYSWGMEPWRNEVTSKTITYLRKDRSELEFWSSDLTKVFQYIQHT